MAARRYRARRSVAIAAAVAAIIVNVVGTVAAWRSAEISRLVAWTYFADSILWIPWVAIGALIALKGVRTPGSTMLAVAITMIGFNNSLELVAVLLGDQASWLLPIDVASAFVAAVAYLRASQLFPRALTSDNVLDPRASWRWAPWLPSILAALLRSWASWALVAAWLALSLLPSPWFTTVGAFLIVLLGAAYWRVHARVGNVTVRNRVTWLLQTAIAFAVLFIMISALMALLRAAGVSDDARAYVFIAYRVMLAIAGCGSLAMAVFSAGAFNPSFVVRGTVVYGAAVSLLLFALNIITSIAIDSATEAFGLSDRFVAATLGAIAGLLLEPVARTLRHLLERVARPATEPA